MASSSRPTPSTGLALPRPSQQRQHEPSLAPAGTSPVASTPHIAERSSRAVGEQQPRRTKKKKQGRGRMMMVKVFYSLASPRFGTSAASPTPSPAVATPPVQQPPSSAFLAVLDPALVNATAPSPTPEPERPPQQSYTCLARLSAPVWVQLMGGKAAAEGNDERTEYGKLTLKTCLSAICISRPELVTDPSKDYAVSAVDPYESSLQPSASSHASTSASASSNAGTGGQGLMEGKGMLSWNLAEKREGTTWVCGRVVVDERELENRRRKRRRTAAGAAAQEEDEEEEDSDDESVKETLEVWLQLVERPSFTQTQFLTSLRSFANPAQAHDSSDRPSSPPRRRDSYRQQQPSSAQPRPSQLGDPIKRKRPRASDEQRLPVSLPPPAAPSSAPAPFLAPPPPIASTSAAPAAPTALQLQDPRILSLLAQLIPSLRPNLPGSDTSTPPLSLDSEQGRALLPAIRTLAGYYGVELPASLPNVTEPTPSTSTSGSGSQPAASTLSLLKGKGKPGPKTRAEHFTPIDQPETNDKSNPVDSSGCFNCKRKKSTKWRESFGDDGVHTTVCNACGVFYNKNNFHRSKTERATSPNRGAPSSARPVGRPLQGRLTATCEQELKKLNKTTKAPRKTSSPNSSSQHRPGMLPPPSPSKVIGPSLSRSPGRSPGTWTSWGLKATVPSHTMTSPGRSPRRGGRAGGAGNLFGFAATSPVRAGAGTLGTGAGLRSGYESDGEGRGNAFSFGGAVGAASIFGGPQSPSPRKRGERQMPAYLLTASPGTALDRILNDTNIDLNSFDVEMPDAVEGRSSRSGGGATRTEQLALTEDEGEGEAGLNHALSFYLRSMSPEMKENARPALAGKLTSSSDKDAVGAGQSSSFDSSIDPALRDAVSSAPLTGTLTNTDAPTSTTDDPSFESVLSSLRRNFDTRLSSNALTAPSSPIPSSPCVQPRTSSATPGSKGKAPQSCGRPAPSILDGFINGLEPAFAMGPTEMGQTPVSDSDAWTPASPSDVEGGFHSNPYDLSHLDVPRAAGSASKHDAGAGKLLIPNRATSTSFLPSHLVATSDVASEYDFGSLPPSSPPLLPSETFPTPSEFDSGITPDEEGYLLESEDATMTLIYHSEQREAGGATAQGEEGGGEQRALSALLQSLNAGGAGGGVAALGGLLGAGSDKIQLDRATVNKLLQMISTNGGGGASNAAPSPSGTSTTSSKPSPAYLSAPSVSASNSTANSPADGLLGGGQEEPFDLLKAFEDATKAAASAAGAGGGDEGVDYESMFAGL